MNISDLLVKRSDFIHIKNVGDSADALGIKCYLIGGFVRDIIMGREPHDMDFVVVGSGKALADEVLKKYPGCSSSVYKTYGTAAVKYKDIKFEFTGARREFRKRDSELPVVEDETLEEDLSRRDFTVNSIAVRINSDGFGEVTDITTGIEDLEKRVVRAQNNPDTTFSDDPVRILRGIRAAARLEFRIDENTEDSMRRHVKELTAEHSYRIASEIVKIVKDPSWYTGIKLMIRYGVLDVVMPEIKDPGNTLVLIRKISDFSSEIDVTNRLKFAALLFKVKTSEILELCSWLAGVKTQRAKILSGVPKIIDKVKALRKAEACDVIQMVKKYKKDAPDMILLWCVKEGVPDKDCVRLYKESVKARSEIRKETVAEHRKARAARKRKKRVSGSSVANK